MCKRVSVELLKAAEYKKRLLQIKSLIDSQQALRAAGLELTPEQLSAFAAELRRLTNIQA